LTRRRGKDGVFAIFVAPGIAALLAALLAVSCAKPSSLEMRLSSMQESVSSLGCAYRMTLSLGSRKEESAGRLWPDGAFLAEASGKRVFVRGEKAWLYGASGWEPMEASVGQGPFPGVPSLLGLWRRAKSLEDRGMRDGKAVIVAELDPKVLLGGGPEADGLASVNLAVAILTYEIAPESLRPIRASLSLSTALGSVEAEARLVVDFSQIGEPGPEPGPGPSAEISPGLKPEPSPGQSPR
jgi:hypothetical protein